jgi:hypothetical protein
MANLFGSLFGGLRGSGAKPQAVAPTKTAGLPGYAVYGGFLQDKETNRKVIGAERWRTYSDIVANTSIVAAGTRHFLNLISRTEWSVEPAKDIGGEDSSDAAKEAAEFFESVLHDMETPWAKAVRYAGGYRFWGFGIQEWTAKRRAEDGRFGILDLQARPQHTIERWDVDPTGKNLGMVQLSPQTSLEIYLPRKKVLYLVDDTLTDSPDGLGLFRHLVEPAARLEEYLRLEGTGFQRDLRGIPVGKAPFSALGKAVEDGVITQDEKTALIGGLESVVKMQAKSFDTGVIVDSQPYESQTDSGTQVSTVAQWGIELLTGNATGIEHLGEAINRLNREMARALGVEQLMLGEGAGTRSLSEDKSHNFFLQVEAALSDIAEGVEKDVLGPVWMLNGFPDELKPTLKYEAVQFRDVAKITASLRDMATAGATLAPNDPAIDDVRDLLGISKAPEMDPDMIEAMNRQRAGIPDPNAEPEPVVPGKGGKPGEEVTG